MKIWDVECVRGADVVYTTIAAETREAAEEGLKSHVMGTRWDCKILGERTAPLSSGRAYDDHDAKMRAADAMIEAMRPTSYGDYGP